jgi:hypothetical protein
MENPKPNHINSFCILNYVMNLDQSFVKTLICNLAFVCDDVVELFVYYCVISMFRLYGVLYVL